MSVIRHSFLVSTIGSSLLEVAWYLACENLLTVSLQEQLRLWSSLFQALSRCVISPKTDANMEASRLWAPGRPTSASHRRGGRVILSRHFIFVFSVCLTVRSKKVKRQRFRFILPTSKNNTIDLSNYTHDNHGNYYSSKSGRLRLEEPAARME